MNNLHLLLSMPPHEAAADANVLAAVFQKAPGEVKFKARLIAPEIWYGDHDAARVQDLAVRLQQAGYRVAAIPAEQLAAVPDASVTEGLLLDDAGIIWDINESAMEMPETARMLAVYCRPEQPPGEMRRIHLKKRQGSFLGRTAAGLGAGRLGVALYNAHIKHQNKLAEMRARRKQNAALKNAMPNSAFLDCYMTTADGILRLSLVEGTVDYKEALGLQARTTARENTLFILERLQTNFSQALIDRRLDNAAYRPATLDGLALPALLQQINPDWKDLDPFDLASRLIFLATYPSNWMEITPELPPAPSRKPGGSRKAFEG